MATSLVERNRPAEEAPACIKIHSKKETVAERIKKVKLRDGFRTIKQAMSDVEKRVQLAK